MNIQSLVNYGGFAVAGASLAIVFLVRGVREETFPGMRGTFLRLSTIAIIFLLLSSFFSLTAPDVAPQDYIHLKITQTLIFIALANLFLLGIYLLRVLLATYELGFLFSVLGKIEVWAILLAVSTAFTILGALDKTLAKLYFFPLLGTTIGMFIGTASMFRYLRHGSVNFIEAFSAGEFYEYLISLVEDESKYLKITSTTPGLVLPSEYNPQKFPLTGERKHPKRPEYFNTIEERIGLGLEVEYLCKEEGIKKMYKKYQRNNLKEYFFKSRSRLQKFQEKEGCTIKILEEDTSTPRLKKVPVIGHETKAISNRNEKTKKIKHGSVIRLNPRIEFDEGEERKNGEGEVDERDAGEKKQRIAWSKNPICIIKTIFMRIKVCAKKPITRLAKEIYDLRQKNHVSLLRECPSCLENFIMYDGELYEKRFEGAELLTIDRLNKLWEEVSEELEG